MCKSKAQLIRPIRSVWRWLADRLRKLKELGWFTGIWFITTLVLGMVVGIVLIVVAVLMYISFVISVGQQGKDFGHLPLAFTGICITLAGLFFGAGQKLFHDLRNAGNEHIKIAVLYALAGILVATFTFIYPSYANMVTPYAVYSIPLWVVSSSLAAGVVAFVVATCLTVILFLRHLK